MSGIKLGPDGGLIRQIMPFEVHKRPVYRTLAAAGINVEFLSADMTESRPYLGCLVQEKSTVSPFPEGLAGVRTLSVYPHRFSFRSLSELLRLMSGHAGGFYDMVTSGSTVTFVVNRKNSMETCGFLAQEVGLPDNHAPFQQRLSPEDHTLLNQIWPQTTAAYVEAKIKIYGIETESDLCVCRLDSDLPDFLSIVQDFSAEESQESCFCFSSARVLGPGQVVWHVATPETDCHIREKLAAASEQLSSVKVKCSGSMAMISFQGPHFGDRCGIADLALTTLEQSSVHVALAGFAGSCVQLVLPGELAGRAVLSLAEAFEEP